MIYTMTDDEYDRLKEACKRVPYLVAGGTVPTPRKDAIMAAWEEIALRVGCDVFTITAVEGSQKKFLAEPIPAAPGRKE